MNTSKFLNILKANGNKELVFEYQPNQLVPKSYHISEIKKVKIESVDCGGFAHEEQHTAVQLWINPSEKTDKNMLAEKAMKIFDLVDGVKPLLQESPIFFEWGMEGLATSTYQVDEVAIDTTQIKVKMSVPTTMCKPSTGIFAKVNQVIGTCGGSACC